MKKFLILFLLIFTTLNIYASEDNSKSEIEIAEGFYQSDDYVNAEKYFKKAIAKGELSGSILYKFGFSLENTKSNEDLMRKTYKASVYYFEKDSDTESDYYRKALNKLKYFDLKNNFSEDKLENLIDDVKIELLKDFFWEHFWIILLICSIIYVIALILSKKTNCVIIYGWKDFVFIFLPFVVGFISMITFVLLDSSNYITASYIVFVLGLLFAFGGFIFTIVLSIIGNIRNNNSIICIILFSFYSIITKIVVFFFAPILGILYCCAAASGKSDKRYKDGTKNNEKTANIGLVAFLIVILLIPLVKAKNEIEYIN
ncbi:MAG: hypothetical protein IIU99_04030 [Treponema sp.]|nr:hypothetical protein [Treponema sp.]